MDGCRGGCLVVSLIGWLIYNDDDDMGKLKCERVLVRGEDSGTCEYGMRRFSILSLCLDLEMLTDSKKE